MGNVKQHQKLFTGMLWLMAMLAIGGTCEYLINHSKTGDASKPPSAPSVDFAIHLSIRPSVLNTGVLQLHNITDKSIAANLLITNRENRQQKSIDITVPAQQTAEIGWTDGWDFSSNEQILLFSKGYFFSSWITTKMDNGQVGLRKELPDELVLSP